MNHGPKVFNPLPGPGRDADDLTSGEIRRQLRDGGEIALVFHHYEPAAAKHGQEHAVLVVEGTLAIDLEGGTELRLGPWQAVTIPAGTIHRTRAIGRTV